MTDTLHGMETESTSPKNRQTDTRQLDFLFRGTGWEYFSIWITNIFLTIVTLGIYSAWAKVRRLKYFYQNTYLDGSTFEFHGKPIAILKGRVLVFGLLILGSVFTEFDDMFIIGALIFLLLFLVTPMLLMRSLRFRYHNSSYRGIRLGFAGKDSEAYMVFLLLPLVSLFSLGLLYPVAHQKMKEYAIHNGRFGNAKLRFTAGIQNFYGAYLKILAIFLISFVVLIVLFSFVAFFSGFADAFSTTTPDESHLGFFSVWHWAIVFIFVYAFFFMPSVVKAIFFNLYWNHTRLENNAFKANLPIGRLAWIYLTNLFGIIVTIGFFTPFAQIRIAKFQIEHIALIADESFDQIIAAESQEASAVGDAFADWFDIDIAL